MQILYTATATATGDGRNGHVATDDGLIDLDLRAPQAMGGAGGATNPEQLFASGYAACFHSALRLVARGVGADVTDSTVVGKVGIGRNDAGGFGLAVELQVHLPLSEAEAATKAVEAAHQVCPYSNATRGNVEVTLTLA